MSTTTNEVIEEQPWIHPMAVNATDEFRIPGTTKRWNVTMDFYYKYTKKQIPINDMGLPLYTPDGIAIMYETEAPWWADVFEKLLGDGSSEEDNLCWANSNQNRGFQVELKTGRIGKGDWTNGHPGAYLVKRSDYDGSWYFTFSACHYVITIREEPSISFHDPYIHTSVNWIDDKIISDAWKPFKIDSKHWELWRRAYNRQCHPGHLRLPITVADSTQKKVISAFIKNRDEAKK